jgi:hypothetical protein
MPRSDSAPTAETRSSASQHGKTLGRRLHLVRIEADLSDAESIPEIAASFYVFFKSIGCEAVAG